jgi:hypothetical protein
MMEPNGLRTAVGRATQASIRASRRHYLMAASAPDEVTTGKEVTPLNRQTQCKVRRHSDVFRHHIVLNPTNRPVVRRLIPRGYLISRFAGCIRELLNCLLVTVGTKKCVCLLGGGRCKVRRIKALGGAVEWSLKQVCAVNRRRASFAVCGMRSVSGRPSALVRMACVNMSRNWPASKQLCRKV